MLIAITGTMGAGKGEAVSYLKKKGFEHYTFSDVIREEARKRCLGQSRQDLQKIGNELRKEYKDEGVIAKRILAKIKSDRAVLDGVRNTSEIKELSKRDDFILIGIDAPQKLRFQRLVERKRKGDPSSFQEFKTLDDKENKGRYGQEIRKCLEMSDYLINNDKTVKELRREIDKILRLFRS